MLARSWGKSLECEKVCDGKGSPSTKLASGASYTVCNKESVENISSWGRRIESRLGAECILSREHFLTDVRGERTKKSRLISFEQFFKQTLRCYALEFR